MPLDNVTIDRLKSQLLTSGLSLKDQPLFQIINQLIDSQRQVINSVNDTTAANAALPIQVYDAQNVTPLRTYDASVPVLADLANVLGTLISDLRARGIVK